MLLVVQGILACVRSQVRCTIGNSSCSLSQPVYSSYSPLPLEYTACTSLSLSEIHSTSPSRVHSTSPCGVQVLLVPKVGTTVVLTMYYKQRSVCNFVCKYTSHYSSVSVCSMKTSRICIDFCMRIHLVLVHEKNNSSVYTATNCCWTGNNRFTRW